MRFQLAALSLLAATVVFAAWTNVAAQEPTVGEFHVTPSSGPVGTVITISGNLGEHVTHFSFWCPQNNGHDLFHIREQPVSSSDFRFDYEIPAELGVRQGGGVTVETPFSECQFQADEGHKLTLAAIAPFVVTRPTALPPTGVPYQSRKVPRTAMAAALLAAVGAAAVLSTLWTMRERN